MYAGRKRRKPVQRTVKPVVVDGVKSNPSKRHRDRLNTELERLAGLLPFTEDVTSSLDKLSILRLSVSYLRSKTFFRVAFKNHNCSKTSDGHDNHGNGKMVDGILPEGELLLQALNGFVLVVTADGLIFFVSPTIQDYLGFHQTDVMHQSVFELIHIEDQQEFRQNLQWALNPSTVIDADKNQRGEKDTSAAVIPYSPEHLPPENMSFLERNFICRFRCLLDNSSGFLALNFQGRLKFLHGQNKKAEDGTPIPSQLALFALATPLQSPSILEVRTKNMIFRTKHKLDFTPLACDAKGKIVLGYTEAELRARGTGYQFIHAADMLHCAENHVRMIKTGESGLTVFRLLTKDNRWAWVQANARLVYKHGKPDYIIATQRPLVDEEGGEELRKRAQHLPFSFATGEALLYHTTSPNPGLRSPQQIKGRSRGKKNASSKAEMEQNIVDPSSLLGAIMQQDESVYVCHPAPEARWVYSGHSFSEASGSGVDWQLVPGDAGQLSQQQVIGGSLDPLLATLDSLNLAGNNCFNGDLFGTLENLGLGEDDLELLLFDEQMVRVEASPSAAPLLHNMMTNGDVLSYGHDSELSKSDQELSANQQCYLSQGFLQTPAAEKAVQDSSRVFPQHQALDLQMMGHQTLPQPKQNDQLWGQHMLLSSRPQPQEEHILPQLKVQLPSQSQFEATATQQVLANGMCSHRLTNPQLSDGHRWQDDGCPVTADVPFPYGLDHFAGYGTGRNMDSCQQPAPTRAAQATTCHMGGAPYVEPTGSDETGHGGQYHSFLTPSAAYQTLPPNQPLEGSSLCQYQSPNPSSDPMAELCSEELQPILDLCRLLPSSISQKGEKNCDPSGIDVTYPSACVRPSGNMVPTDKRHPYVDVFANPPTSGHYIQ
ncbi:aryl hydrocarbon receptor 1b [Narcine bancroftii]|uniref:aryl hydrocarbon receptor 1b n=1 Tax=Narcine bancroftii TaxID=1343680 RepID=UPI003831774A